MPDIPPYPFRSASHDAPVLHSPELYVPPLPLSRSNTPVTQDGPTIEIRPMPLPFIPPTITPIAFWPQPMPSQLEMPVGSPPQEITIYKGAATGHDDTRGRRSGQRVRWHDLNDHDSDSGTDRRHPRDIASEYRELREPSSRSRIYRRRSPSPVTQSPYITVKQTWSETSAAWTPAANVERCKFVVYRRRRAFADSERVFTLVQFVDRELLNSVRSACPTLDGLYAHDGMVSLNLLYPHIDKLRNASPADGLSAFLEFVESEYEPHRKRIEALVADGQIKYEYLWAVYKPGAQLCMRIEGTDYIGGIVDSAEYLSTPPGPYFVVKYRTLEWTGGKMYWASWTSAIVPFEGCEYITAVGPRLADDELRTTMAELGRRFLRYADGSVHHVQITGTMVTNVARDVSARGRGMVDPVSYSKLYPTRQGVHLLRPFEHPLTKDGMPDDMLWLLPAALECYSFVAHAWGAVRVADIEPVVYDAKAWDRLVLGSDEKETLRVLLEHQRAAAATILLHGPTGLGKTFTVEALAEALRRPLYSIGSADHNAPTLGSAVDLTLDMAERWNAIMLLEDVDGHCASQDAHQRRLPDSLLRALESRQSGALFLTARQRSALPPAVVLRITYAVEYTELDVMQRLQLWERSVDDATGGELFMLARNREDHMSSLHEFARKPFNPLSIKKVVQIAHALALSKQEPLASHHFCNVNYAKGRFLLKAGLLGADYPDSSEDEDADEGDELFETE